jgi:hypothetical protein
MKFANATKFDRKSGVAEGPAVSLSGRPIPSPETDFPQPLKTLP